MFINCRKRLTLINIFSLQNYLLQKKRNLTAIEKCDKLTKNTIYEIQIVI